MSSTEQPTLSPVLRRNDTTVVERGGKHLPVGGNVSLAPEHYRYGDPLLEPHTITLHLLWIGELRFVDDTAMIPLEGVEIAPVAGRKRSILANFSALCAALPMNPAMENT